MKKDEAGTNSMLKRLDNERVDRLSRYERKELVRAALVMLMWREFLARQRHLLLCQSFVGCSVTVTPGVYAISHCKCLNNTVRAISVKLDAANVLASVGLVFTQPCLCVLSAIIFAESVKWVQVNFVQIILLEQ